MGFRGKYKNKRDGNEEEIFTELRDAGMMVYPTDKPLDAVCGFGGATYLIEVKNGTQARLTASQRAFLGDWTGHAVVLTSQEEARVWAENITYSFDQIQDDETDLPPSERTIGRIGSGGAK